MRLGVTREAWRHPRASALLAFLGVTHEAWRHSRALALLACLGVTREAWRWSLGLAVTWVGGARFTDWKPRAFLLGGCGQGSNSLLLASWGGEKRGGAGEDGEGRGGPEGSSKAAVSAMRKTFRGGSPEDRWSSGSLTSWRRDSSGGGREHGEDGLAPPRGCFAPPRYRVRLEDLDELHRAAWQGDVPGVERVLAPGGPGVDERDKKQRTALHLACVSGHPAVVALLVDRKCQLNCFDSDKRTALIKAVQCRKEECAAILLEQGADPDLPDIYGNTALHYAVHNEDRSLAEKLLLYSTNMEAKNENDLTPLLFAISGKRQQMVEFLLERGANLLAVDKCRRTALILAVQCGSANIVSLLLQQNIDIFSQDVFGRTAEDYAIFNQFIGIQQLISEYKEKQTPESLPQNSNPEQEKMNIGVVLLSGNNTIHDMCRSQLPENKESKEDWHPTTMTDSDKTCERSKNLKVDDKCLPVSPSTSKKQSDIKELGQTNSIEQEKMNIGVVLLSANNTLHDVCQSQLPENKKSKEEEQDLELPSEEEEERLKGRENKQPQKMSQEPEMAKDCDREDIPVYSLLPHVQNSEQMWIEQGKLEWKNKFKLITNELKQRFGETGEKYKIPTCPEEEHLLDNSTRGTNVKDIPSNWTNNIPGCEEEDASEVPVSVVFKTFPEQKEPSLKNVYPSHPYSGSLEHACQSSCKLHLHKNKSDSDSDNKPGIEHICSTDENFYNDAPTKKARNPEVVTVEMKEDQESDLQMTKNKNRNSDSCSTNNYKNLKPELENLSFLLLDCDSTSVHEELQQDMQRFKNEVDMIEEDLLALKKENIPLQKEVEEEIKQHTSNNTELSGSLPDGAAGGSGDDGLHQQFPRKENEVHGRAENKTSPEKNKVKNQIHSRADFADSMRPSETASECEFSHSTYENFLLLIEQLKTECKDSVSLSRIKDAFHLYEHFLELKNNNCERLTAEIKHMGNTVSVLQKELSETKDTKLQLEHQKIEWEQELGSLRLALRQEKEKRENGDMLCNKHSEQLRIKEEECREKAEMTQRLKWTLRKLIKELRMVEQQRNDAQQQLSKEQNARVLQDQILTSKQQELEMAQKKMDSEISHRHKKEKDLLHENCMLQKEIALLRLEIDTITNQNQQKEKKYFEDIEAVKENNDNLQKIIKLYETLTKTIFQYSGQPNDLAAENKILNSELENEKQNQERPAIEMESYRCRLAAALCDCDQSQTQRDLNHDFLRKRQEWIDLQDKTKADMSDLRATNEILSEKLTNVENKINSLQIQLRNTTDAVEEKNLILEGVQRDLSQTQCQKKEIEQMYQTEQNKLKKYIAKQESVEERLFQLQNENTLLRQQLDAAHKKVNRQEKTISTLHDQFQALARNLQADSEKQSLPLQENKELLDECHYFKNSMDQCEKEKPGRKDDLTETQETAPSQCLHVDTENEVLRQILFAMKAMKKKGQMLQKKNKELKQEVLNLKSYIERHMLKHYEVLIEGRSRQSKVEKLKEISLLLQTLAASQEQFLQRENDFASERTQMELTIKDLKSELSRIQTSQADKETELERYKELFLEEVKAVKFWSNELRSCYWKRTRIPYGFSSRICAQGKCECRPSF
ncbi:coiled-coil domain-containing protein 144A-like isoform X2 [Saimiri boliviensis]|uniref:coiled-coil domain-containing protein 144A-like isoform X2 n=1 Tax=Saimiri boliviensis TaxID=27679 RepID=UPI003D76BEB8